MAAYNKKTIEDVAVAGKTVRPHRVQRGVRKPTVLPRTIVRKRNPIDERKSEDTHKNPALPQAFAGFQAN